MELKGGIPAFNATCLGKWSIVLNATSHKDQANKENKIIEPSGKIDAYDGVFFKKGGPFNQGKIFDFSEESFFDALDIAVNKNKSENKEGLKLKDNFHTNQPQKNPKYSKLMKLRIENDSVFMCCGKAKCPAIKKTNQTTKTESLFM